MSKGFILIDSKYRRAGIGSSTDFIYDLSEPINISNRVFLKYASIPLTSYLINNYNRTFKINSTTITLDKGNYTQDSFKDHLQNKLNSSFPGIYTVIFNANTYKFTISQASNFTLDMNSI